MTAGHMLVLVLLWAGVGFVLLSVAALAVFTDAFVRLHVLAPAACAGVPLIAAAVALEQGGGRGAVKTLLIGLLFAAGGTVTTIALGKATWNSDGKDST